jgi:hypothetical protein
MGSNLRRQGILTRPITQKSPDNTMISEMSHSTKNKYCMTLLIGGPPKQANS